MFDHVVSAVMNAVSWLITLLIPTRVYVWLLLAGIAYLGIRGWPTP